MSDIVTRLKRILSSADERGLDETECRAIQDAVAEIKQLRQEVCMLSVGKGGRSSSVSPDAIEEADRRGWDCFGKNK